MKTRRIFGFGKSEGYERGFHDATVAIIRFMDDTDLNAVNIRGFVIAGGFLRRHFDGLSSPDVDIFCRDRKTMNDLVDHLTRTYVDPDSYIEIKSPNCSEVRSQGYRIQVVHKDGLFDTPEDLINAIDFDACRIAWDKGSDYLVFDDLFEEHARGRILNYVGSGKPKGSFKRAIRFIERGYKMTEEGIDRLLKDLQEPTTAAFAGYDEEDPEDSVAACGSKLIVAAPSEYIYDPFAFDDEIEGVA